MSGEVVVTRDGATVTLTMSHPERRNALSYEMYATIERECASISVDPAVRALVLRGAGGSFAGGTDIRHLADLATGDDGVRYEALMRRVQLALLDLRIPIISVVKGACVGGGLVFAALSDLVFCTPDARFGSPIARTIGNTLSPTSIARLLATFGRRRTSEMLLTGRLLDAAEAQQAGFVTALLDEPELENRLRDTLAAVEACAPLSLRSFKEFERRIDAALFDVETDDVYRAVYNSADFREGVAAFLERRPARFEGN